ncbi:serine/threonine-protein kinase [Microbacterium sp. LWO12-1.2]|uniref:serine/threonine-protein kinase n=1 Tax=Microbacterium sp. LWO12-1.2 TaxID=3135261 RepID=UPI003449C53A
MTLDVVSPATALLDDRYLLEERVGRGGMSTVYRATDTRMERPVAIKMIHEDDRAAASADRAHTEKALLAAVDHRSLVTLYDAQLIPGRPRYLVMEFVDGPTLARRLTSGPMRARQVARFTRDLAEGLAVVHAAGIIHRDVKPSNIMLARNPLGGPWTAKLADFGIACEIGSPRMTSPGIVLGTFAYMAPELLRDAEPGTAGDVFGLGLVALEALTGSLAYPANGTGRGAATARVMNPPVIPDRIHDEWRDLLERMTRLDPLERPTAAQVALSAESLMRVRRATTVAAPATA